MKIILTILILIICSSCTSIQLERVAPFHATVYEISKKPYIPIEFDCLDKAQAFQAIWEGAIILNVQLKNNPDVYHALIWYKGWVLDCTSGKEYQTTNMKRTVLIHYGKIVKFDYKERKYTTIPYKRKII